MTDSAGTKHEAVVMRDMLPEERPLIVAVKDGLDTEICVRLDPTGNIPLSWRLK